MLIQKKIRKILVVKTFINAKIFFIRKLIISNKLFLKNQEKFKIPLIIVIIFPIKCNLLYFSAFVKYLIY